MTQFPNFTSLPYLVSAFGGGLLVWDACNNRRGKWYIFIALVTLIWAVCYFVPTPIYAPFKAIYDANKEELGIRKDAARNSAGSIQHNLPSGVVEAWADRAIIVWIAASELTCAFPINVNGHMMVCHKGPPRTPEVTPELFDRTYVKSKLKLTESDFWPRGGIADLLINNQKEWGWIGKIKSQCVLDGSKVFYQNFDNGLIIGPLRSTPSDEGNHVSIEYAVFKNLTAFREVTSDVKSPPVNECDKN